MASSEAGLDRGRSSLRRSIAGPRPSRTCWTPTGAAGSPAPDLERLATVEILTGKSDARESSTLARAHEEYLVVGDVAGAARCAGWIGVHLMNAGQMARSTGWFARAGPARRQLSEPCAVEGLVLLPRHWACCSEAMLKEPAGSSRMPWPSAKGSRTATCISLSLLGTGQASLMLGDISAGLGLLDEVMVAVTAGELSPVPSGIIYCAVIGSCHLAFDLRAGPGMDGGTGPVVWGTAGHGPLQRPVPGPPCRTVPACTGPGMTPSAPRRRHSSCLRRGTTRPSTAAFTSRVRWNG